jgi:hypothetical protein
MKYHSKHEIQKIHKHLGWLLEETQKKYGGISLLFSGDFRQMEPCMTLPLYSEGVPRVSSFLQHTLSFVNAT